MLYSHPALAQNSYWNPGRPCQVVINYSGSRGSVLQTDLRELRAFSSRICFQDLGCRAAKLSTKGTDPMSSGSATPVPLQPQGAHKLCTAVFLGRQGGGQQGNSPAQAALPWTQRFPGQNNFCLLEFKHNWAVLEEGTAELFFCSQREGSWVLRKQQLLWDLMPVAGAWNISYPKKWQSVTQDSCEVKNLPICEQFIVFPALGNPSFITKWDVDPMLGFIIEPST